MQVRANTGDACLAFRFEGGQSAWRIEKSVGQGGVNRKDDVLRIQKLLNRVATTDGGPMPPLAEDGITGPLTIGAIRNFQKWQKLAVVDGRVDPAGPTLRRLNEVKKDALSAQNAARLARTAAAMPDLIQMAKKAQRAAEEAMDFHANGPGLTRNKRAWDTAELYFAFGHQAKETTQQELRFIRTTYTRVLGVLAAPRPSVTGGNPFGLNIFTIDPLGRDWMAYSPMQLSDDHRDIPEVHSGLVYLANNLDTVRSEDWFKHILFHETVHFVDDESKERRIVDHGYREKAMRLPHNLRMHNSDNYALFASHVAFGRARLVASQPALKTVVPETA